VRRGLVRRGGGRCDGPIMLRRGPINERRVRGCMTGR
jgi:hypothetical protein